MNKIKAIIFDYDGVIAESVDVKTQAFAKIYESFGPEIVGKVIRHHEANGGVSRYEKFKIYHGKFLGLNLDKTELDRLCKEFSALVLQKVIDSPYVKGVEAFISSNYLKYDFYISTGTPKNEIDVILSKTEFRKFFRQVFGSPEKKELHVRNIIKLNNYKNREVVFIGDALSDRDAARKNNIHFIGRFTTERVIKKEKYLLDDFTDIRKILTNIISDERI